MDKSPESACSNPWAARFERFRSANMTVAEFCAAEGVSVASYYYWRRKLEGPQGMTQQNEPEVPHRFVPVTLADPPPRGSTTVMAVDLPGGIRVRLELTSVASEVRT